MSIPLNPADGVDITVGDASLSIGLPELESTSTAVTLESGAITYPSRNGVANTVVAFGEGVQLLTTINSSSAPARFPYEIDVPAGGAVSLAGDGSAVVSDMDGNTVLTTNVPWAVDANGTSVPTRYEVVGTQLVQIVDHVANDASYPVVADPTFWWGGKEWWSSSRVNVALVSAGVAGYVGMVGPALLVGSAVALCNQAGRGVWVYWTWAGQAWCTGP